MENLKQNDRSRKVWCAIFMSFMVLNSRSLLAGSDLLKGEDLERRIWTEENHSLHMLESDIVRVIQHRPNSSFAFYLLAHSYKRMYELEPGNIHLLRQASDIAQHAIDVAPHQDYGYVALAGILDLMGNPQKGVALIDDALGAGVPNTWRMKFAKARLTANEKNKEAVLKALKETMAAEGSLHDVIAPYVVAIERSIDQGFPLVERLNAWNAEFPSSVFELTIANTYTEMGMIDQSAKSYNKLLAKNPDNPEALINSGVNLYQGEKAYDKAIANFIKVLAQDTLPQEIRRLVRAHLASAYLFSKKYSQAHHEYLKLYQEDTKDVQMLDFIVKKYREKKEFKKLTDLLQQISETSEGSSVVYAVLGETLSEKLSSHEDAVVAFQKAIILSPNRSDFYNGLGLTYYRLKDFGQALLVFKMATDINPSDATARYNEACMLSLLNQRESAILALKDAVALDPRLVTNARSDGDFTNLKDEFGYQEIIRGVADLAH